MDSVGEGEGGKIWENGIETCVISCMKRKNKIKTVIDMEKKKKEWEEERWQVKDLLQRPPEGGVGISAQTCPCLSLNTGHYPHKPPRAQGVPVPWSQNSEASSYLCHNLHMSLSSLRWSRGALKYTGHINTTPPKPANLPVTECRTNHCSRC